MMVNNIMPNNDILDDFLDLYESNKTDKDVKYRNDGSRLLNFN